MKTELSKQECCYNCRKLKRRPQFVWGVGSDVITCSINDGLLSYNLPQNRLFTFHCCSSFFPVKKTQKYHLSILKPPFPLNEPGEDACTAFSPYTVDQYAFQEYPIEMRCKKCQKALEEHLYKHPEDRRS